MPDSTWPTSDLDHYEASSSAGRAVVTPVRPAARPTHWRLWIALVTVLVTLRLAMPIVLGPLAEEKLSHILGARVEVGDVSFAPIDAVVTLRNVTVHAQDGVEPVIGAARVRIDVQWLPLLHRTVVVRELAIESALIDFDRVARVDASLERLARVDPAAELPPGWTFALDHVALRDTRLRVHDPVGGERPALDVDVRDAQVATRQRRASAFRRAPNLRVDALVDGGRIRVDGSSDLRDEGVVIDALVRVKDVPVDRLQPYLPDVGWTAVAGRLSGRLHYQRDPERRDLLTGRVRGRGIGMRTPAIEQSAVAIRKVEAEVDAIDLFHRRVAIRSLLLHGARLAVHADLDSALSWLDDGTPGASPARPRPAGPGVADAGWSWTIRRAETRAARLHVAGADGETVLAGGVVGENLGPRAYWSPLRAWVSGGAGVAEFDGSLRMTRGLRVDGRLTAHDVDAPALARAVGAPMAALVQAGRGSAGLDVEIEPAATDAPKLGLRGDITVDDVWLAGPEADAFAIGARSVHLGVTGVAREGGYRGGAGPTTVQVADATVTAPYVLVTHTAAGWLLPPFATEAAAHLENPERPVPAAALLLARVQSSGGRVLVVDRATKPQVVHDLAVTEGWARDLRVPDVTASEFVLHGAGRPFGEVRVAGSTARGYGDVEVVAGPLPLAAAAPYLARAGLPYWFVDGTGSVSSHLTLAGGRWDADTALTVREPRFGGDQAALERALGMPIDEALGTLRDPAGDATLHLALASPRGDGMAVDGMVAVALREGMVRARQGPFPDVPLRIAFANGGADVGREAARQLAAIADVLDARPDAVVELSSEISHDDRRGLAEQAAGRYLTAPRGLSAVLRVLGVRDQHTRIREALAARAAGEPGRLDPQDEAVLRALATEGPPVDDQRLVSLATDRLRRVADVLADRYGISPARVIVNAPTRDEVAGSPAVRVKIDGHYRNTIAWTGAGRW